MIISRETTRSLVYRCVAIGSTFISVSFLLKNLGPILYGAWATLISVLAWIQMSDLGIGAVIKNRVAGHNNLNVLTAQIIASVRLTLLIALILTIVYLNIGSQLSIVSNFPYETNIIYIGALLCMPAMISINILQGLDRASISFRTTMLQNISWLALVLILGHQYSLRKLAIGYITLWIVANFYNAAYALRVLNLKWRYFVKRIFLAPLYQSIGTMLQSSIGFFVLQLSALLQFSVGTYLAYTYYSAASAAEFDILNKIFQLPIMLFNVLISIAWSNAATMLSKNEDSKAKQLHSQLLVVSTVGGMFILLLSPLVVSNFISFYSHERIEVNQTKVLAFAVQSIVQMFLYSGAVFMNAAERLKVQIVYALLAGTLFFPVFYLLKTYEVNITAIPISILLVLLPGAIYFNYYARRHVIESVVFDSTSDSIKQV